MRYHIQYAKYTTSDTLALSSALPVLRIKKPNEYAPPNKSFMFRITNESYEDYNEFITNQYSVWVSQNAFACYLHNGSDGKKFDAYFTEEPDGYYYMFVYPSFNKQFIVLDIDYACGGINFIEPIINGVCEAYPDAVGYKFYRTLTGGVVHEIPMHPAYAQCGESLDKSNLNSTNALPIASFRCGNKYSVRDLNLVVEIFTADRIQQPTKRLYAKLLISAHYSKSEWVANIDTINASDLWISDNVNVYVIPNEDSLYVYVVANSSVMHYVKIATSVSASSGFSIGNSYEVYDLGTWTTVDTSSAIASQF